MKKNITVNLCGRLYSIDEDAYELMNHYLETLRNYFSKQTDGDEICNDIEARMVELFDELKAQGTEAITIEHVQDIIHRIGDLKDIIPEDEKTQSSNGANGSSSNNGSQTHTSTGCSYFDTLRNKRFYRDPADKKVAGVLSGCAQYFGGSSTIWRIVFVVLLLADVIIVPLVGSIFSLMPFFPGSFSLKLSFAPLCFFFIVLYIVTAIIAPEARRPEDRLKMRGETVNPQHLAQEVTEMNRTYNNQNYSSPNSLNAWNIISGILLTALGLAFSFMFIIMVCFTVISAISPSFFIGHFLNYSHLIAVELYRTCAHPLWFCIGAILANAGILTYCTIHGALSSFKKVKPMSVWQRLMWFALWLISLVAIIGLAVRSATAAERITKEYEARSIAAREQERTHDGFVWTHDGDWEFFQEEGWKLIKAENCEHHFANYGEHFTGEYDVHYLDGYNSHHGVIYTAERKEYVEPGTYRLVAAARTKGTGAFIYAASYSLADHDSIGSDSEQFCRLSPIINDDDRGGTIHKWANNSLTAEEANIPDFYRNEYSAESIASANNGLGYGWNFIVVDSIVVSEPCNIHYGVTSDPDVTNRPSQFLYFSATDFKLEKVN